MEKLNSKELRNKWIKFFESKDHLFIKPKSLIPLKDPSLLWINSGVATLKKYFSNLEVPPSKRLTNSQKSIRTSDIENVGITSRHHTLFEMLGSFSIGDYFKDKAISLAYEFIFDILNFQKEEIYITYYEKDIETYEQWISLGIKSSNLIRGNKEMNFWDIGQGPCGPNSEIFFDRGKKYDPENLGIIALEKDIENDRYIEIWNIVFSEFNNDGNGNYTELPQKNIDTGAGLERILSILQNVPTNFDTDLFLPIIYEIENITGRKYEINNYFIGDLKQKEINKSFKIIADHIRASVVAINDGALPSNNSRGYIIRRLVRRSYRLINQLGNIKTPSLHKLTLVISKIFPMYKIDVEKVSQIIRNEEIKFSKTISKGKKILDESIKNNTFNSKIIFKLYETYGYPIELTQEIVEEKGLKFDKKEIQKLKDQHSKSSRGKTFKGMEQQIKVIQEIKKQISNFTGYHSTKEESAIIFEGFENGKWYYLFKDTPFYAAKGGQMSDTGFINDIPIENVFKDKFGNNFILFSNKLPKSDIYKQIVDEKRLDRMRNHSSTHLLNSALIQLFGNIVKQVGSENNNKKLRFDFTMDRKPNSKDIESLENIVNSYIKKRINREYIITNYENAIKMNALTLGGGLHEGEVRLVRFGDISIEFCGGTHISNTSMIENFKILKVESKGSEIFRIEAISSNKKIHEFNQKFLNNKIYELEQVIIKNKKIDSNYQISYDVKSLNSILNAISLVKIDSKKMKKNFKNKNINFENYKKTNFRGYNSIVITDAKPSNVKQIAISLREHFVDSVILVAAKKENIYIFAVASKKENSKNIFDEITSEFGGSGGGQNSFAMGTLEKLWEN
ncbi:MAG: alanine--tRNA ligase [Mollicutes bacterium PWAP]|nr:alanine--tRNA ligase [Mollicutes bacterium PWAP]